jgi:transposase-like protein
LILDGTVVGVRLDRKATSISLLEVIGVRGDEQKVLLAVRDMRGETTEAWRTVLDDLIARDLRRRLRHANFNTTRYGTGRSLNG